MPFKKRVAPAMWGGGQTRPNLDLSRPSGKLKSFRPTHPEVDQFSGEKRNIMWCLVSRASQEGKLMSLWGRQGMICLSTNTLPANKLWWSNHSATPRKTAWGPSRDNTSDPHATWKPYWTVCCTRCMYPKRFVPLERQSQITGIPAL